MADSSRILKWLGVSLAIIGVGYVLVNAALFWFGNYMSQGELRTSTGHGNLLVALSDDPAIRKALLSGCRSTEALSALTSTFLSSGLLAEIPSGTKMHMLSWDGDPIGTMT